MLPCSRVIISMLLSTSTANITSYLPSTNWCSTGPDFSISILHKILWKVYISQSARTRIFVRYYPLCKVCTGFCLPPACLFCPCQNSKFDGLQGAHLSIGLVDFILRCKVCKVHWIYAADRCFALWKYLVSLYRWIPDSPINSAGTRS